jgi:hypothetical protein
MEIVPQAEPAMEPGPDEMEAEPEIGPQVEAEAGPVGETEPQPEMEADDMVVDATVVDGTEKVLGWLFGGLAEKAGNFFGRFKSPVSK